MVIVAGKKGGHKGRVRMYTSPDEIDAQMKEEKERKKVGGVYIQRLFNRLPHGANWVCATSHCSTGQAPESWILHFPKCNTVASFHWKE